MKHEPILTVAIPTYNRSKTLERIIQQLEKEDTSQFVLLISDDKSPDDTEETVKKYLKKKINLVFHKNTTNLGYSANVSKLYEMAQTKYVWFLCDDDTVLPGAITRIVSALEKHEPTVAVFSASWINPYGEKKISTVEETVVHTEAKDIDDYQAIMRTTFLSIVVVEKQHNLEFVKHINIKNNIFFQLSLSIYLLSKKFRLCEVAGEPIIHRNVGYKYGEFFKFYLIDHLKASLNISKNLENSLFIHWSKRQIGTAFQLYLSQKLGLFRYYGKPTNETLALLWKYYGLTNIIILAFIPLYYLIPTFLLKGIYFMRLVQIHGLKNAKELYRNNINRAYLDERKTGFTKYR